MYSLFKILNLTMLQAYIFRKSQKNAVSVSTQQNSAFPVTVLTSVSCVFVCAVPHDDGFIVIIY